LRTSGVAVSVRLPWLWPAHETFASSVFLTIMIIVGVLLAFGVAILVIVAVIIANAH
jgi:hypothetical protein